MIFSGCKVTRALADFGFTYYHFQHNFMCYFVFCSTLFILLPYFHSSFEPTKNQKSLSSSIYFHCIRK